MNVKNLSAAGIAALLIGSLVSAVPANAQDLSKIFGGGSSQSGKNTMRNVGIGAGAAAAYELLHGKGTNALILGAGAAYAGKKYEDARKAQNKANNQFSQSGYHRVYRYDNGTRTGYDVYDSGGRRVSRYNRVYSNNHWTNSYQHVG